MKFDPRLMLAASLMVAYSAMASQFQGEPPPPRSFGIERALMHDAIAQQMANRSGVSVTEVAARLRAAPPPSVARAMGFSREQMRDMERAAADGLIARLESNGLLSPGAVGRAQAPRQSTGGQ